MTPAGDPAAVVVVLRDATDRDVPDILRCIRALAEYERLANECVATEARLRETLFGADPAASVVLAVQNLEVVGFALWFRSYSTFLARPGIYLEDLFVFPSHRGLGVGRRLLAHLARRAVERDLGRLEWAVLDWNVEAIRFYESLGAVPMADWTTFRLTGDALEALGVGSG
ncbi:MAG: GNAT family N-acetyltransferase [Gemmatimonadaceae bacterium]|nr:GNAT family N-acetyltransferase [Gemmatimonadaceae bacterium]